MDRQKIIGLLNSHGITVAADITDAQLEEKLKSVMNGAATNAAQQNALRIANAHAEIDRLVESGHVVLNDADFWKARAATDPTVVDRLKNVGPDTSPLNIGPDRPEVTTSDPRDVGKWILNQGTVGVVNRMLKGGPVSAADVRNAAIATARHVQKNLPGLMSIINANTVDTKLKRNVIMNARIRDFKRRLIAISAFSTVFNSVPLEGTDKVEVPYYALDTQASKDYVDNDGYVFDKNTDTGVREITIDKRKYQPFDFSSKEFARQPAFNTEILMGLKAEKLAEDVTNDWLSVVTAANYGATVKDEQADAFDYADVVDIRKACKLWPTSGRSLVLDSDYDANLLKDPSVAAAFNYGNAQPKQEGIIPVLAGFRYFEYPTIPANGERLKGFAAFMSAILGATSPIMPAEGVRRQLVSYDVVIDPETGIAFEYRHWGEPQKDGDREVVECNYGYQKGEGNALKRITSPV